MIREIKTWEVTCDGCDLTITVQSVKRPYVGHGLPSGWDITPNASKLTCPQCSKPALDIIAGDKVKLLNFSTSKWTFTSQFFHKWVDREVTVASVYKDHNRIYFGSMDKNWWPLDAVKLVSRKT
jgi:hypothetical protein